MPSRSVAITSKVVWGVAAALLHSAAPMEPSPRRPLALAIHGGSGTLKPEAFSAERRSRYEAALLAARDAGWAVLESGGAAVDAVEASAVELEACPLFNAGVGAVFTADGGHELDAAIMCGSTRRAGAVAGVRTVRHPIRLARVVMETSGFVFVAGEGAEALAQSAGLERVDPSFFDTDFRREELRQAQAQGAVVLDHDAAGSRKFGTIGVVALDQAGNIAAATSTGGLTNKRFGRIGDTPVIGAGTYADNATCAVSCTGYGEEFIRAVVAHDVAARIAYLGESLETACRRVILEKLPALGGSGGLIALNTRGELALVFNTEGMYRAWRRSDGEAGVAIFGT